jgi:hypothetical protein
VRRQPGGRLELPREVIGGAANALGSAQFLALIVLATEPDTNASEFPTEDHPPRLSLKLAMLGMWHTHADGMVRQGWRGPQAGGARPTDD